MLVLNLRTAAHLLQKLSDENLYVREIYFNSVLSHQMIV